MSAIDFGQRFTSIATTFLNTTSLLPSTWRHAFTAISREYNIRNSFNQADSVIDLQAAHSTRTAEEHYARTKEDLMTMGASTFLLFLEASQKWQSLMGYAADRGGEEELRFAAGQRQNIEDSEDGERRTLEGKMDSLRREVAAKADVMAGRVDQMAGHFNQLTALIIRLEEKVDRLIDQGASRGELVCDAKR